MRAVGLVGSWARGEARFDSDVDIVLLTREQTRYLEDESWAGELGELRILRTRRWGPTTERRLVLPSGPEVEVGIAPLSRAATDPVDPGTCRVVRDGIIAIYDPEGLLTYLPAACSAENT